MWEAFWEWAWQRHHNVLSWYSRPILLLPYVWFAYRRSLLGMVLSIVALLTSMFWFPAPARPEPWVAEFLAAELGYLQSPWTLGKTLLTLTVPLFFVLLGVACWRRSWVWGVAVMAAAAVGKMAWSLVEAGDAGWAIALPAVIGLAVCVGAVVVAQRVRRRRDAVD